MASAAASRPPSSAAMQQWLGPRVSFSLDDRDAPASSDATGSGGGAGGKGNADFEFFLAGSTMLPADELFSGGRLVPLRVPSSVAEGVSSRPPLVPEMAQTPREEEAHAKDAVEHAAAAEEEEPKVVVVPARRWRDLLRMRKQQASSSSSSSSATADTKPLRRLLRRGPKPPEQEPSLSLPLLRDREPDKPPSAAPSPAPPPSSQQQHPNHHQLPPKIRLTAAQQLSAPSPPPPPPPAVAADSPRLNAAGKVVFNALGRSASSPSSLAGGRRHRTGGSGGMERSYSAHVRVTPVLNVPVCRKSVSVFGIDRLFSPSSASTAAAAAKKGRVAKKEAAPPSSQ